MFSQRYAVKHLIPLEGCDDQQQSARKIAGYVEIAESNRQWMRYPWRRGPACLEDVYASLQ